MPPMAATSAQDLPGLSTAPSSRVIPPCAPGNAGGPSPAAAGRPAPERAVGAGAGRGMSASRPRPRTPCCAVASTWRHRAPCPPPPGAGRGCATGTRSPLTRGRNARAAGGDPADPAWRRAARRSWCADGLPIPVAVAAGRAASAGVEEEPSRTISVVTERAAECLRNCSVGLFFFVGVCVACGGTGSPAKNGGWARDRTVGLASHDHPSIVRHSKISLD